MAAIAEISHTSRDTLPVCLWLENPHRLVSLWDMVTFLQDRFAQLFRILGQIDGAANATKKNITEWDEYLKSLLIKDIDRLVSDCKSIGLRASAECGKDLLGLLASENPPQPMTSEFMREFCHRFEDELRGVLFLAIPLSSQAYYETPREQWGVSPDKFSDAIYDIEEASKCIALHRSTACVFHLMRVMEHGLKGIACAFR